MNFTDFLYKNIGNRIKNRREALHLLQTAIIEIDTSILSRIENGKAIKNKNPYLMNEWQITCISNALNISKEELIWGTREEQENFVKMIILSILMNGNQQSPLNPFHYPDDDKEFLIWANKQKIVPDELRNQILISTTVTDSLKKYADDKQRNDYLNVENAISISKLVSELKDLFSEQYSFFFNKENYKSFETFFSKQDEEYQRLANTIFKQLLQNYSFTVGYTKRVLAYISNTSNIESSDISSKIESLLLFPSQYMNIALDYKEMDYFNFIQAFEMLWNNHSTDYMNYFDSKLFKSSLLDEYGLKKFQNKDFDAILKSDEFYNLSNTINVIDAYYNPEAVLANNYNMLSIQSAIQRNMLVLGDKSRQPLFEHLSNISYETGKCAISIL